jgi:predicted GH43/DUF377 family glycosyl hydrolase
MLSHLPTLDLTGSTPLKFVTLARHQLSDTESRLATVATDHGLSNVFNPSIAHHGDDYFVAFRAESFMGERPFRAYVARFHADGTYVLTDLSATNAELGTPKTADPKLVELEGEVFVTFNTGNVHAGENSIYLQQVTPAVGPPQRCVVAPRRMVEKNWAFFSIAGQLKLIYSLAPLTIWRLRSGTLGTSNNLVFEADITAPMPGQFPRIHIGSQPLMTGGGRAIVVANQQRPLPGLPRKIYFGRLVSLDLEQGRLIAISRRGLLHSWRSMLPRLKPHNPGLFSATYFSGVSRSGEQLVLSYGVNDTSAGIAKLPESSLWK